MKSLNNQRTVGIRLSFKFKQLFLFAPIFVGVCAGLGDGVGPGVGSGNGSGIGASAGVIAECSLGRTQRDELVCP